MKTKMKTRFRLKAIFFFGEELLYPTKRYLHNCNIRLFYLVTWYLHLGTTTTMDIWYHRSNEGTQLVQNNSRTICRHCKISNNPNYTSLNVWVNIFLAFKASRKWGFLSGYFLQYLKIKGCLWLTHGLSILEMKNWQWTCNWSIIEACQNMALAMQGCSHKAKVLFTGF